MYKQVHTDKYSFIHLGTMGVCYCSTKRRNTRDINVEIKNKIKK